MWLNSKFVRFATAMDKLELGKAFTRLGQLLRERRVAGEIAVFGGAAIVLGFDFRDATQDVDIEDIVQLARRLGCTTAEDLLQLVKHYYPDEQVLPEKVLEIRSIARHINAPHEP